MRGLVIFLYTSVCTDKVEPGLDCVTTPNFLILTQLRSDHHHNQILCLCYIEKIMQIKKHVCNIALAA